MPQTEGTPDGKAEDCAAAHALAGEAQHATPGKDEPLPGETVKQWAARRADEKSLAWIARYIPVIRITGEGPSNRARPRLRRGRGSKLRVSSK